MSADLQRILIVEDDKPLRLTLAASVKAEGFAAVEAGSVTSARQHLERPVGLIVLDLGLPDEDGMNLLRTLREAGDLTPIIVLTARGDEATKVAALDLGADDYVTKPFGLAELLARMRSALRHGVQVRGAPPIVRTGGVEIDLARRSVSRAGQSLQLSRKEFDLLAELAINQGRPVAHEDLLQAVRGSPMPTSAICACTSVKCAKIGDDAQDPTLILAEPGFGYRLA